MCTRFFRPLILSGLVGLGLPVAALAQGAPPTGVAAPQTTTETTVGLAPYKSACGNELQAPAAAPPDGTAPTLVAIELCFAKQGGRPILEPETYLFYVRATASMSAPSQGRWVPFTDATAQTLREDFQRLWQQGFLDDLSVEVNDYVFPNGAVGKVVSFHMEERERVKTVRYDGTKQIDRTKIEEQLRERGVAINVDSFLDAAKIRRVETILREMMLEKGFNPDVTHKVEPIQGASSAAPTKTVNITFLINEGPKVKIKRVEFTGNTAFDDKPLIKQLKENKPSSFLSLVTGTGTFNQAKFEDDAERVSDFYQNRGYPNVRVGQPEVRVVTDSKNGKTRWVELRVPVTEGALYNFGELDFDGNARVRSEFLRAMYDVRPGEIYNRKKIVEGNRRAQETYGSLGFMEFTPFPDLTRSDQGADPEAALMALVPEALQPVEPVNVPKADSGKPPTVDVTIRITEGEQFFINRIVFTGNTTTRDNVVRRELGTLLEGAPFNSEALKVSVRRINQLGYFKPLEGNDKDMKVDKTPGKTNMVDVTVKLEEQNRNQLTFGAGVSQYEGFFGQLAFSTSNFLGRGESLTLSLQGGERARNYQLGFTEPFLFDRNITGGVDLHKRELRYEGYYTQKSTGGSLTLGMPLRAFTRFFVNYSYESVSIGDLNEALLDPSCVVTDSCSTISSLADLSQLTSVQQQNLCTNPFACDALLLGSNGKRTISKVTPSLLHNTVDHPIFPTTGRKYTASVDLAAFGGNTQYIKPHLEGIWFFRQNSRTSIGLRGLFEYITPLRDTRELPVFERLFLGGEYSIRGFDIRSIGPTVPNSLVVLGGNKSILFNAEYLINIAGPVRLVLFYDAGQVRDEGEKFAWQEDLTRLVFPPRPDLQGILPEVVTELNPPGVTEQVIGQTSAFKTSTGVEVRFFMPVLNVPFRLIYAWNPQREGVLDNSFEPAKRSVFRFAVGTTF